MTALVWDRIDERDYEFGIDRGVIYGLDSRVSVWNGLIKVSQSDDNSELETIFFDGKKVYNANPGGWFKGEVEALSFPEIFLDVLGLAAPRTGFYLTDQVRSRFNLTYRTLLNDDHYKLHLIYNAGAKQTKDLAKTTDQSISPNVISWEIDTIPPPPPISTVRPTSHLILDSRKVDPSSLEVLEEILYGSFSADPEFPSLAQVYLLFSDSDAIDLYYDTYSDFY